MRTDDLDTKVARLHEILENFREGALVAFSGGVDSTLLLAEAHAVLGERCAAFTADSPSLPRAALEDARRFAASLKVRHFVAPTREMINPHFLQNGPDRCFHCKGELFASMRELGLQKGYGHLLYGAVVDDLSDVRPGMQAAREAGARAPLLDAGFTKEEVRGRSRALGIAGWDRPSAACLASRIPTGRPIVALDLAKVEAAEDAIQRLGFPACRVRLLGDAARVELPIEQLGVLTSSPVREEAVRALRGIGFSRVTLDLEGYRPAGLSAPGAPDGVAVPSGE
jgi:pyridinium-3,5-biscarboxylic acid mononucleotide sulfurtransferase